MIVQLHQSGTVQYGTIQCSTVQYRAMQMVWNSFNQPSPADIVEGLQRRPEGLLRTRTHYCVTEPLPQLQEEGWQPFNESTHELGV